MKCREEKYADNRNMTMNATPEFVDLFRDANAYSSNTYDCLTLRDQRPIPPACQKFKIKTRAEEDQEGKGRGEQEHGEAYWQPSHRDR